MIGYIFKIFYFVHSALHSNFRSYCMMAISKHPRIYKYNFFYLVVNENPMQFNI